MRDEAALERMTNLTFALNHAQASGRPILTKAWIAKNVGGYARNARGERRSEEAISKLIERDRRALERVGVPIETHSVDETVGYRLAPGAFATEELEAVEFTPEEARVLALAGQMGLGEQLAAFSRSGWTKLAATGLNRELATKLPQFVPLNDWAQLDPEDLDTILVACAGGERLSFFYTRDKASDSFERWLDPWGIVNHRDHLYVVGWDLDREAIRAFRTTRLSEVEILDLSLPENAAWGPVHPAPEGINLQEEVAKVLNIGKSFIDAVVRVEEGAAHALVQGATALGENRFLLEQVDRDWLMREAAKVAPAVVVEKPEDLARDVVTLLRKAEG